MHESSRITSLDSFYKKYGSICLALAAATIMSLVLFADGGAGLSNNGDFARVMSGNSLTFADTNVPYVYQNSFRIVFKGLSPFEKLYNLFLSTENIGHYPSIQIIFVRVSIGFSLLINVLTKQELSVYHIQALGFIYLMLYSFLLLLLFRSFQLQKLLIDLLLKTLFIVVLCDEAYITYFNSFYSEPVQMLGLLAMAVFALRCFMDSKGFLLNASLFFISCVVYGWSKFINIPIAILCILGVGAVIVLSGDKKQSKYLISCGAICVTILCAIYFLLPQWMDYETNYNSVFFGMLKDSTREQRTQLLKDLSLPEYMAEYACSNFYSERAAPLRDSADFKSSFLAVSKFDILTVYLKHPGYFKSKLDVALAHSGLIRPYYLSNLGPSHERLTFANRFAFWSNIRSKLPFGAWPLNIIIIIAACLSVFFIAKKEKRISRGYILVLTVLALMIYQFIMPIIANGEGDLAKHMFAYVELIDLLLLFLLSRLALILCSLRRLRYSYAILAAGMAVALCPFSAALSHPLGRSTYNGLETGAFVRLGSLNGEPVLWQVIQDTENNRQILFAASSVVKLPFDRQGNYGSNLWAHSDIRKWLNGTFLTIAFTPEERDLLLCNSHRIILSAPYKGHASSGSNEFFAFHVPAYSDRGMYYAFAMNCNDTVRLPDIGLMARLSRLGLLTGPPCWFETPYYNNDSMLRYLGGDGYFYMRDAIAICGVRPVLEITDKFIVTGGSGTVKYPYSLSSDNLEIQNTTPQKKTVYSKRLNEKELRGRT